jgi:peptidoglycan hydrolase-like protein with peptidoglycan-binding domain
LIVMPARNRASRGWDRRLALALAGGLALAGLAAAAPASADYFDGITAYENRDYATAHRELQPLADAGDARAQRLVGLMYRDGLGVRQDWIRAYMWFELADRGGQQGAAELRNDLSKQMQISQIEEAERMAGLWQPVRTYAGNGGGAPTITAENLPAPSSYDGPLSRQQLADLQWQLAVHGYDPGASDSSVGPQTQAAIRRYQLDAGLPVDGRPSAALLEHLQYTDPPVMNRQVARASDGDPPDYAAPADIAPSYGDETRYDEPPQPIGAAPSLRTIYTVTVQQELAHRGYHVGAADGVLGRRTRAAIRDYQRDHGLPVTGEVSLELVNHLRLVTTTAALPS